MELNLIDLEFNCFTALILVFREIGTCSVLQTADNQLSDNSNLESFWVFLKFLMLILKQTKLWYMQYCRQFNCGLPTQSHYSVIEWSVKSLIAWNYSWHILTDFLNQLYLLNNSLSIRFLFRKIFLWQLLEFFVQSVRFYRIEIIKQLWNIYSRWTYYWQNTTCNNMHSLSISYFFYSKFFVYSSTTIFFLSGLQKKYSSKIVWKLVWTIFQNFMCFNYFKILDNCIVFRGVRNR